MFARLKRWWRKLMPIGCVRDVTAVFPPDVVYTRENGYFKDDEFDGPEWQFGRDYLDLQHLHSRLSRGDEVTKEEMLAVIKAYCGLMHQAAYLRGMYNSAMEVMNGRAQFREK